MEALARLEALWDRPLDREAFDVLFAAVYRTALFGVAWEQLSWWGRLRDRLVRRALFGLLAPTRIGAMHQWFAYCVQQLQGAQPWLREGLAALAERPVLVQHAVADRTLEIGMARELTAAIPGARSIEYGEGYDHVSIAFRTAQARRVVADHIRSLEQRGAL